MDSEQKLRVDCQRVTYINPYMPKPVFCMVDDIISSGT